MSDTLSIALALGVTWTLLYGLRPMAQRIGLMDWSRHRETHAGRVPVIGGLAMFFGFVMSALTLDAGLSELRPFFAACALLVLVGVLDDMHELSSRARFAAQILAAVMMVAWGGVLLRDLGLLSWDDSVFELGNWAVPFSVFCAVGVINALNMSDGVDGLAGGLALTALVGLAWVAHASGMSAQRDVLGLLAGVVLAFLWVNARLPWRPRALVFMGDAGSMFLGFAITWFVIHLSQGPQRAMPPVAALWLLLVPLFDTVWLLIKRPLSGRWPTAASHDHLHHMLQMVGLGPGATAWFIWAVSVIAAAGGLWALRAGVPEDRMFWVFIVLFVVYCVVMASAWRRRRLLLWPMERRFGGVERRRRNERRQGDRRRAVARERERG